MVLSILAGTVRSAPVWAPLALLLQVTFLGHLPARAESQRLEEVRAHAEAIWEAERLRYEAMSAEREAWSDPIYRERLRRLRETEERPAGSDGVADGASSTPPAPEPPLRTAVESTQTDRSPAAPAAPVTRSVADERSSPARIQPAYTQPRQGPASARPSSGSSAPGRFVVR